MQYVVGTVVTRGNNAMRCQQVGQTRATCADRALRAIFAIERRRRRRQRTDGQQPLVRTDDMCVCIKCIYMNSEHGVAMFYV